MQSNLRAAVVEQSARLELVAMIGQDEVAGFELASLPKGFHLMEQLVQAMKCGLKLMLIVAVVVEEEMARYH